MRWPWRRRGVSNGASATQAREGASEALRAAHGASGEVDRAVKAAASAALRTDRFIRTITKPT